VQVDYNTKFDDITTDLPIHVEGAIATLAAAMIIADDVVDPLEVEVAYKTGSEIGVRKISIDTALKKAVEKEAPDFMSVLGAVPLEARAAAAALLFEIADIDGRLDRREIELLQAVREVWGVQIEFLNRPLVWDHLQQEIIEGTPGRKVIVSAGPGMGKTSVACARVAYLIKTENVHDGSIWLVSFTRAAIAELNGRIDEFSDDANTGFAVKISTIDSQAWMMCPSFCRHLSR